MATSTSRLRLAPDAHSDTGCAGWHHNPDIGPAPQTSRCVNNGYGAGSTHNHDEGADMAKNTRGPAPHDRWTRDTGVNITPPTHSGPVTTTPSAR